MTIDPRGVLGQAIFNLRGTLRGLEIILEQMRDETAATTPEQEPYHASGGYVCGPGTGKTGDLLGSRWQAVEVARLCNIAHAAGAARITGYQIECREVEQILGKVLGYPWYKNDPDIFPGATAANGVCVGEHVAGTIAAEAATRITTLTADHERLREALAGLLQEFDAVRPAEVALQVVTYAFWKDAIILKLAKAREVMGEKP